MNHLVRVDAVHSLNNLIKQFKVLTPVRLSSAFNYALKSVLRTVFHLYIQVHWDVLLVLQMESDEWMSWVEGSSCRLVGGWGLFTKALFIIACTITKNTVSTVSFWVVFLWVVWIIFRNTWQSLLLLSKFRNLRLLFFTFLDSKIF